MEIIVLLASIFISRIIHMRALNQLNKDKKGELVKVLSGRRMFYLATGGILLAIVFIAVKVLEVEKTPTNALLLIGLVLIALLINAVVMRNKLVALDFPEDYLKAQNLSQFIRLGGILATGVLMAKMYGAF